MPKKCESCRFFKTGPNFDSSFCSNPDLNQLTAYSRQALTIIDLSREVCDREGDGIFVYFEPKAEEADHGFIPNDQETREMFNEACARVGLA